MRRLLPFAVLLVLAVPAAAQTVAGIAQEVELRGYYTDGVAEITIDELEALVDAYPQVAFVALDATPAGGADLLADQILNATSNRDTVIVLTATEAGAASAVHSDSALDSAFDRAFATSGDTYRNDFDQIAGALSGGRVGGGGGGFSLWWVVIAALGFLGFRMWRNQKADGSVVERRFDESRREIGAQMAAVANQILELSDRIDLADDAEARSHFRQASEIYRVAEDRLAQATTTASFEQLADDLDDARWELAAAEARLEGRPAPDKPSDHHPEPCFFDPTHGAGVEEAELSTPAGKRTVRVCVADADRLRKGEHPEPRSVSVGGRAVPAPTAPRSHGGGGMDALDVFSILVGGMGRGTPYRWGGNRRPTGGFGMPGGFAGSRTRSTASAARSVARSVGRARRGR